MRCVFPPPQDITATVKRDFEAVSKDNNFIYNDLVPDFGTLEPPGMPSPHPSPPPPLIPTLPPPRESHSGQACPVHQPSLKLCGPLCVSRSPGCESGAAGIQQQER